MKIENYLLNHSRTITLFALAVLAIKFSPPLFARTNSNTNASDQPAQTNRSRDAMRAGRSAAVAVAVTHLPAIPPGPVQPTWESIRANYKDPDWFRDGKFGFMMHWGIYSVPAHGSEWYVRYIYGGNKGMMQWHTEHFGSPTNFGYKDFFPRFTAAKWDPDAWAKLFKDAGAKYVIASGEHHDGFPIWIADQLRLQGFLPEVHRRQMGPGCVGEIVQGRGREICHRQRRTSRRLFQLEK